MKYIYFIIALLTITTSCELRSTNFDPDNQFVSEDELAQIAVWDQYQTNQLSAREYESLNFREFINADFDFRQNSSGKWVIEGSIKNFASEAHFQNTQLNISYYNEQNNLLGTEKYTTRELLAPGDQSGFYFKSDKFKDAHSLDINISAVQSVK